MTAQRLVMGVFRLSLYLRMFNTSRTKENQAKTAVIKGMPFELGTLLAVFNKYLLENNPASAIRCCLKRG